jgi:putative endonuclease
MTLSQRVSLRVSPLLDVKKPAGRSNLQVGGINPGRPTMQKQFFVYILTNDTHTVLYTGVTNDLVRRVCEHREGVNKGFTKRYRVRQLIYYEVFDDPLTAIQREKQIKAGSRQKKLELINKMNPNRRDLYEEIMA